MRDDEATAAARPALVGALEAAVPLWIWEWRNASPERRADRARECGQLVASHGDQILFRSKGRAPRWENSEGLGYHEVHGGSPGTAQAFNRLAEGIALGAYQPGGITVFDQHWCAGGSLCSYWRCGRWGVATWQ